VGVVIGYLVMLVAFVADACCAGRRYALQAYKMRHIFGEISRGDC
jgi:hypothetical protein